MVRKATCDAKCVFSESNCRRERRAALRLQAQEHTGGFENRGLPLPVRADHEIETGRELDRERFETTKCEHLQLSEHAIRLVAAPDRAVKTASVQLNMLQNFLATVNNLGY
jgi:hypothetical protein